MVILTLDISPLHNIQIQIQIHTSTNADTVQIHISEHIQNSEKTLFFQVAVLQLTLDIWPLKGSPSIEGVIGEKSCSCISMNQGLWTTSSLTTCLH